ncbi:MAG: nuclear transport factor 2 family protein [Chloroflexi bacterium]|nr:nuclear transport factor 2 family protein [Chloroflexota bacterium]MYE46546.1 nuclear transport factor 2 family protein [Chloroflexota bacterium]
MALTLEDREAIRDLFARQNLAYDRREAERTAAMFTEDGVLELIGPDWAFRHEGREGLEAYMRRLFEVTGDDYRHWTNSLAIEAVEGAPDEARVECYIAAWGMSDGLFRLAGRYFDHLRKVDGEWKFAHRRYESEWMHPGQGAVRDELSE